MGELVETNSSRVYIPDCFSCFDEGHVLYKKKINEIVYQFVARCYCRAGNNYSERVPLVTEIYDKYKWTKHNFQEWFERHKDKPEVVKRLKVKGVI